MVITYTRQELAEALKNITHSIEFNRKRYAQTGSTMDKIRIIKETARKDFLKLELMKDQLTFNL